jgi:hypothetical protein
MRATGTEKGLRRSDMTDPRMAVDVASEPSTASSAAHHQR